MKRKSTGTKHTASDASNGRSKDGSTDAVRYPHLVLCVKNGANKASLEVGKVYRVVKPFLNDPPKRLRVVDEEGEDYLYPADWFVPIDVAPAAKRRALKAVKSAVAT